MKTKNNFLFLTLLLVVFSLSFISSAELDKTYLCEKTKIALEFNLSNEQLIREILFEKNIGIQEDGISFYRENWMNLCSNVLNITLNPQVLCNKIYYLILETDWNYSYAQLNAISFSTNLSLNILNNYINSYNSLCLDKGFSNELPKQKFPKMIINKTGECDLNIEGFFGLTIPFPEVYLGKKDCNKMKFWSKLVRLEYFYEDYRFTGIRLYLVILFVSFLLTILILSIVKSNRKIDKILEKEKNIRR